MTIEAIRESKEDFLIAEDIASILGAKAQSIRDQAQKDPAGFPFPVLVLGTRVKIPRKAFVEFYERCIGR